jgi:hypothetical protein
MMCTVVAMPVSLVKQKVSGEIIGEASICAQVPQQPPLGIQTMHAALGPGA